LRKQQKYQFRYDASHASGRHAPKFGIGWIHEPVLSGALSSNEETLITYPDNPDFYAANPGQFYFDPTFQAPAPDPAIRCTLASAGEGRGDRAALRHRTLLQRFSAERMGERVSGGERRERAVHESGQRCDFAESR